MQQQTNTSPLNIKTLAITCVPAIIISILSTLGMLHNADAYIWLFIAPITAWYVSKNIEKHWYIATLALGLIWGLSSSLIKIIFLDKYLSVNPDIAESLSKLNSPIYLLILKNGIISGIISALIISMLTLAFLKRSSRNKRRNQEHSNS